MTKKRIIIVVVLAIIILILYMMMKMPLPGIVNLNKDSKTISFTWRGKSYSTSYSNPRTVLYVDPSGTTKTFDLDADTSLPGNWHGMDKG